MCRPSNSGRLMCLVSWIAEAYSFVVYRYVDDRFRLKLTIDRKVKDSIRHSKNVSMAVTQLTPPVAKVPCSPEPSSPGPENSSFYDDLPNKRSPASSTMSSDEESNPVLSPVTPPAAPDTAIVATADDLSDVLQMPSNWAQELGSLSLAAYNSTEIVATGYSAPPYTSSPGSHFEFPEVSDMMTGNNDWLDSSFSELINCWFSW